MIVPRTLLYHFILVSSQFPLFFFIIIIDWWLCSNVENWTLNVERHSVSYNKHFYRFNFVILGLLHSMNMLLNGICYLMNTYHQYKALTKYGMVDDVSLYPVLCAPCPVPWISVLFDFWKNRRSSIKIWPHDLCWGQQSCHRSYLPLNS